MKLLRIVKRHVILKLHKKTWAKGEIGTKSLSQRYLTASEATSKIRNQDDTFYELSYSQHHALIKSHRLERFEG
ncbi:MAG: hypothetical protein AB1442_00945 [Nitrospirota bacterium]